MKPQDKLSRVGWGVVITGGKSGPFLGFGRNFFEKRSMLRLSVALHLTWTRLI